MFTVLEIINAISGTSSRKQKEEILARYKDNEKLKTILKFVYDPYIVTGLSDKKMARNVSKVTTYTHFFEILEYLYKNNTGRDEDIAVVKTFLDIIPSPEMREFCYKVVTKSLKIGMDAKSINKVISGLVSTFDVMLAEKYWDYEGKLEGEFYITPKLDGIRCVLIKSSDGIKLFSRQGHPIEGLVEIEKEAESLAYGVFDGELIAVSDLTDSKELYKLTTKIVRRDGIKKGVAFHVFDKVSLDGFKSGEDNVPYKIRRRAVDNIELENLTFIKPVPVLFRGTFGKDDARIIEILNEVTDNGGEGIMINLADSPYECKRVKTLLKVKKFKTADVRVVGLFEGTGKYVGKLGGVTIQFEHEGKLYECDCGSGFTDEERTRFWQNPEWIDGKIIQIKYFEVTQNDGGGYGLRFPTFEHVRYDKDEISLY